MLHSDLPFSFEFTYSCFFYIFLFRTSSLLNSPMSSFYFGFLCLEAVKNPLPIVFRNGFKFNYLFYSFPHTADFNHKDIQEIIWLVVGQSPFRDKLVFNSYDGIDVKGYMREILKRISGVTWRYAN